MQKLMCKYILENGHTGKNMLGNTLYSVYEHLFKVNMSTCTSKINSTNKLVFFVNGQKVEDNCVDGEIPLVEYLRYKLHLCGTKLGCSQGGCGSCTVMVSKYDRESKREIHYPVNSCVISACTVHGLAVTTIEGIGSTKTQLHPAQERIAKAHGSQCGFCTPGFVMSMYSLLRQKEKPNMVNLEETFQGHLCRCGCYRPIIEGTRTFTQEWEKEHGTCCKKPGNDHKERLYNIEEFKPYNRSNEPEMPEELRTSDKYDREFLIMKGPYSTWLRPITLEQVVCLKKLYPTAKIVAGETILFQKQNKGPISIHVARIPELKQLCETSNGIKIGAAVCLEDIKAFLRQMQKTHPEEKTRLFKPVCDVLHWLASKQIRHQATAGGNLMAGLPVCDLIPIFMACRVHLEVHNKYGPRMVCLEPKFYEGKRKTILDPSDVLVAIHVPMSNRNQYFKVLKQSKKREVDINLINLAVKVEFEDNTNCISTINLGVGGVNEKVIELPKTQQKLKGMSWTPDMLEQAYPLILEDIDLKPNAVGGMVQYRQSLLLSLFFRAFLSISKELSMTLKNKSNICINDDELSGIEKFEVYDYKSSQYFNLLLDKQPKEMAVHRPMINPSAFHHATGEAIFVDDMPRVEKELSMALVLSTQAHAKVVSIDPCEALKLPGVHSFLSQDDLPPDKIQTGKPFKEDEQIFYSKKVTAHGQFVGAILADSYHVAHKAVKLVKVSYEPIKPVIITFEDAIKHKSFFPDKYNVNVCYGNVDEIMKNAPYKIRNQCRLQLQKHVYGELPVVLAVPTENDVMEIYSSSQSASDITHVSAATLGIPEYKVKTHVKRVGGAFGGKRWKAVILAQPAVFAAQKFQRPVRLQLNRRQDITWNGGRTPILFDYTVGFDDNGKILACEFEVYANCGYSLESKSRGLMKVIYHLDNGFNIPAFKAKGVLCKTNLSSTTQARGYGSPEGQFPSCLIVEEIAECLGKDPVEVNEINLYKEGDETFYGQKMENCTIRQCWDECVKNFKYWDKRKETEVFNCKNRYKKRGLGVMPSKFGIAVANFPPESLQGSALINIFSDGSALLYIGGVEMGQGLHTKCIQVAATCLGIPPFKIRIDETATNVLPHCPAASTVSSDFHGAAVLDACRQLDERLAPIRMQNPKATWEEIVTKARKAKINLSANGFYKYVPKKNPKTKKDDLFNYFTFGVACSEVEVDVLTGDHKVLRTDIVMDVGKATEQIRTRESLNPAIDIGQIEGAFMFGYGFFTMEEVLYSPDGIMRNNDLGKYKVPGVGDMPVEFNVSLLKGASNPRAVYSSKGTGEPPLVMSASVYLAIRDAVKAFRKQNGLSIDICLDPPATVEKIRMACEDKFTQQVPKDCQDHKRWSVLV